MTPFLSPFHHHHHHHHHHHPPLLYPAKVALEKFLQAGPPHVKVALVGVEDNLEDFVSLCSQMPLSDNEQRWTGYGLHSVCFQGTDPVLPDYVRRCFDRLLRPTTATDVHVGMYRAHIRASIQACHECINGISPIQHLKHTISIFYQLSIRTRLLLSTNILNQL